MNQRKLSPRLIAAIMVALFFGVALCLRVFPPYDQVFAGEWIKFTGFDAYYHMRIVDNLVHNFPQRISFDPYVFYPQGALVSWPPFFDWLLGSIILLISLGSPTQHTIDVVGVYFPAVLGALTVIPVYFIGKALFNRWVGVFSAGLIALLPGQFLGTSVLGFTDHHVAEVLFSTVAILFLILAIKSARERQLSFSHVKHRDWVTLSKPLIYSLLTGLSLGIYIVTWAGALFFVFIIFLYFAIQSIIDHLRHEAIDYLGIVGTPSLLIALIISLPLFPPTSFKPLYLASLPIAMITPLFLAGISRLIVNKKIKPAYYPLTLFGLALAGVAIFYIINPSFLKLMATRFTAIFTPGGFMLTVLEVRPLLFPEGHFSLSLAWGNFTTTFFLSFLSLAVIIYLILKRGEADKTLVVVWSAFILAATLAQARYAYYLAVNMAVLTGYLSVLVFFLIRFIIDYLRGEPTKYLSREVLESPDVERLMAEPVTRPRRVAKKVRQKRASKDGSHLGSAYTSMALASLVVFFLVFFPNIKLGIVTAGAVPFAPSDAWYESLSWLKENTPEPFGDPDFYYEPYNPPPPGQSYEYPESAYGVMAWWDYGHWITRIAHRLPNHGPGGGWSVEVGRCLAAQDEASVTKITDKLDSKYIIIDHDTATGKFYAVAEMAGRNQEEFYSLYYLPQKGGLVPRHLFYPEYYRSLSTRLYNFDGKTVVPEDTTVISYQLKIGPQGEPYREITSAQSFSTYKEAQAYVSSRKSDNYRIVGDNPFISPVPLDALESFKLIYSSKQSIMEPRVGMIPEVKIFERIE